MAGDGVLDGLSGADQAWAKSSGFSAKPGEVCLLPDQEGVLKTVLFGAPKQGSERSELSYGVLAAKLPSGSYHFEEAHRNETLVALALCLHGYEFSRYKENRGSKKIKLVVKDEKALEEARRLSEAHNLARDLINTPANDMGPLELSNAVKSVADTYGASFKETVGDKLLDDNFPLIHAVGRASSREPRLIDMTWGDESHPKVTLVGKGVIFDTGGLNIKTGNFMTLMKKDMGGAANVLALAKMVMDAKLPVRLRLLIPAVENAISGNAFRPGDILPSRLGLSVEITNTDAEGRLVLADALALADEEEPDILIDMATLTGAARVALGPDLPPFYTHDEAFADELKVRAKDMADPLWHMPLWAPYQSMLDTPIADVNHAPGGGFAGSITAALFLERFVKKAATWAHFDVYGWTPTAKPARPKGGEAQAIRALYDLLKARF
ncbi:MAG: leucyl aminopeptidase family protein [Hyphomicrobiales bacterium]